eukprot:TRINITY_DN50270_c0_g1_i1.p3 TRINITY_DN50270_c0_g1~~TRINITY_DN50270_c0_g1_i1.p3  ORF type:complete len:119 (-),score=35.12 TRINITY_DN50270_c0_g1_i1:265-621(-)
MCIRDRLGSFPSLANAKDMANYCRTGLHYAAAAGHTPVVLALLDGGAEVDYQDFFGQDTALHQAAENNHEVVIEALLRAGANRFLQNDDGCNALETAVGLGNRQAIQVLQTGGDGMCP